MPDTNAALIAEVRANLGQPIYHLESRVVRMGLEQRSCTYEELLALFNDNENSVRPLVLRCQAYEQQIRDLADRLEAAEAWGQHPLRLLRRHGPASVLPE